MHSTPIGPIGADTNIPMANPRKMMYISNSTVVINSPATLFRAASRYFVVANIAIIPENTFLLFFYNPSLFITFAHK